MNDYTPPTQDEIQRVAEYWARVKRLACEHKSGLTFNDSTAGPACSDCGESLVFLTEEQVQNLRARPEGLNALLARQLHRGGVRFAINGQWHEVRLEAHRDPITGEEDEDGWMSAANIRLMLNATEA